VNALIEIEDASFNRGVVPAITAVNWTVRAGEHWVLTGNIGAGKSTLIQALSGACHRSAGRLSFPQLESRGPASYEARQQHLQVVSFRDGVFDPRSYFYQQRFNSFAMDGTPLVRELLCEVGFDASDPRHAELIEQMGLQSLLDAKCVILSSGQSRRLVLAKALLRQPDILVLDNPHLGLDAAAREDFNRFLDCLVERSGLQLILALSSDEWPACITHRLHLNDCRIAFAGPLAEMPRSAPAPEADAALLARLRGSFPPPPKVGEVLFDLRSVDVRYGTATILDAVTWRVRRGEKWSLLGDNGAGKSTLLALLFGDHPQAYANEVYVFGHRRGPGQSIWEVKAHTGFTSSELHQSFAAKVSCRDAAVLGLSDTVYRRDEPTLAELRRIDDLFAYFDISALAERPFHAVSTGEQRVVLLIRALAKNPALLLLDEPFQAFDSIRIARARRLLSEVLGPEHSLVFITHYVAEIPDRVEHHATLKCGVFELAALGDD